MAKNIAYGLILSATLAGCISGRPAPEDLPYRAGRAVANELLLRLTNPRDNPDYRIGVVNTAPATGMLLAHADQPGAVQFIQGNENFIWAEAAEQISVAGADNNFALELRRTTLTGNTCPALAITLEAFFTELDLVLSNAVAPIAESPGPGGEREEIIIDGTYFIIQVMRGNTTFAITPDPASSTLYTAARNLHSIVSGCSDAVPGTIEAHYY